LGTYLDGKAGAEKLIAQAIQDPALLATLAATRPATTDIKED
jgi:type VI secretion system protein ImpB